MPNCFALTRIGSHEPTVLQDVDTAICQSLELPWDKTQWVEGWYDIIGFLLACGKSFADITDHCRKQMLTSRYPEHYLTLIRINHFLLDNYSTDAWVEIGRR
jgi:hypothetical protein